jgi:hypothetical protein
MHRAKETYHLGGDVARLAARHALIVAAVAPCELGQTAHPGAIQTPAVAFGVIGMCGVRRTAVGGVHTGKFMHGSMQFEDVVQLLAAVPFNVSSLCITLHDSVDRFNQLSAVLAGSQHHQMKHISLRSIPAALTTDDAVAFIAAVDGFRGIQSLQLEGEGVDTFAAELGGCCSELRALAVHPITAMVPLLPVVIARCRGDRQKDKLFGTRCIRELLSIEMPPIDAVLESGALPDLMRLCHNRSSTIQFEAAWAITNIAFGSHAQTNAVVEAGAVPMFVDLLRSPSNNVGEQAAWALSNIAADSVELRDIVIAADAVACLAVVLQQPRRSIGLLRNGTRALSNLLRGSPKPNIATTTCVIPLLVSLLRSDDNELLTDAAWGVCYASEADNGVAALLAAGAVPNVVAAIALAPWRGAKAGVALATIRCVGNFVQGTDLETQAVIDAGVLSYFTALLRHRKRTIRQEVCWTLSNVAAGTAPQIQAILDEGGGALFQAVLAQCAAPEKEVKKEALWCVANIGTCGTAAQVHSFARDALNTLCAALKESDARLLATVLEGLDGYLRMPVVAGSEAPNAYATIVRENGGLAALEALQRHQGNNVYTLAAALLESYFVADAED